MADENKDDNDVYTRDRQAKLGIKEPGDLQKDLKGSYEANAHNMLKDPSAEATIQVPWNHFGPIFPMCGPKKWNFVDGNTLVLTGKVLKPVAQGDTDLTPEDSDKASLKLGFDRKCIINNYSVRDPEGVVIAVTEEPNIPARILNYFVGSFLGYNIVTSKVNDQPRWVIHVCGLLACPAECAECEKACDDCKMGMCDFKGCIDACKTSCTNCLKGCPDMCKAKCNKCIADCKAMCNPAWCKAECTKQCDMCKAKCTQLCNLCKAKCEECKANCPPKLPHCLQCTCFTLPWHQRIRIHRPWDTKCEHWVTEIHWDGKLNCMGHVLPDYKITIKFPEDTDNGDRAALVALATYADHHLLSRPLAWCPASFEKKE